MCGGLSKNGTFVRAHADVLGLPVILPEVTESVLLGAAILAAAAFDSKDSADDVKDSKHTKDATEAPIVRAMRKMGGGGKEIAPRMEVVRYHDAKYSVFLRMLECQRSSSKVMSDWQRVDAKC